MHMLLSRLTETDWVLSSPLPLLVAVPCVVAVQHEASITFIRKNRPYADAGGLGHTMLYQFRLWAPYLRCRVNRDVQSVKKGFKN